MTTSWNSTTRTSLQFQSTRNSVPIVGARTFAPGRVQMWARPRFCEINNRQDAKGAKVSKKKHKRAKVLCLQKAISSLSIFSLGDLGALAVVSFVPLAERDCSWRPKVVWACACSLWPSDFNSLDIPIPIAFNRCLETRLPKSGNYLRRVIPGRSRPTVPLSQDCMHACCY